MINIIVLTIALIVVICFILIVDKNPKILIYTQIIYVVVALILMSAGITSSIKFLSDGINILILVYTLFAIKKKNKLYPVRPLIGIGLFFIVAVISALINQSNIPQFLWAIRNTFRAYIFFLGCVYLLEKKDVKKILKILDFLVLISVVICSYQYFVLKLNQDNVGGILGTITGVNACMNMLLCVVITNKIIKFLSREISIFQMIVFILATLIIATLSELKIYYFEFVNIFMIAILTSKPSKRTIILICFSIFTLIIAISTLYVIYDSFKDFFSLDQILEYSKEESYNGEKSLNRMSSITIINERFFNTNMRKALGIGPGNAEVSTISILNSEFSEKYSDELEYVWFSQSIVLIETGFIGLIIYILSFLGFMELKNLKKDDNKKFTFILSLLSILFIFYDASLRQDFAYIWFFALSTSYINQKDLLKKKRVIRGIKKDV